MIKSELITLATAKLNDEVTEELKISDPIENLVAIASGDGLSSIVLTGGNLNWLQSTDLQNNK